MLPLAGAPVVPVAPQQAGPETRVGRELAVPAVQLLFRRPLDVARDHQARAIGEPQRIGDAIGKTGHPASLPPPPPPPLPPPTGSAHSWAPFSRVETNASVLPSGDHLGCRSEPGPAVNCLARAPPVTSVSQARVVPRFS